MKHCSYLIQGFRITTMKQRQTSIPITSMNINLRYIGCQQTIDWSYGLTPKFEQRIPCRHLTLAVQVVHGKIKSLSLDTCSHEDASVDLKEWQIKLNRIQEHVQGETTFNECHKMEMAHARYLKINITELNRSQILKMLTNNWMMTV